MFKTHFDRFVMAGDRIECEVEGITYTARLEHDEDTKPTDFDCYSEPQIQAWQDSHWAFFGVIISAEIDGVSLGEHLTSLWGIEANFPAYHENRNDYFREVANELLSEAVAAANREKARIIEKLAA